ncbi:ribokinase [Gryllotalpicola reticulitermitis]|uniref:Ribokinase n=1 Tax=Gryllotalpicola reticulitermitis TaxID=1184153 RepID=A0ABV8Q4X1_9MICO
MSGTRSAARVIVVGSVNEDYLVRVSDPPLPGETVIANSILRQPGGKGANQAVAAARLGVQVALIAAVGDDAAGRGMIRALEGEGVATSEIEVISNVDTGLAFVAVQESGENSITVVPGANLALGAERVRASVRRLASEGRRSIVVVQAELPTDVIRAALITGWEAGARCVLNLAPYRELGDEVLYVCDPLIVNESEASSLVGYRVADVHQAARAAHELGSRSQSVVITLGARGAYWAAQSGSGHVAVATRPDVVDTTGAGDALVGALAAALANGSTLEAAVEMGVAAGTFAVTSPGAQTSYATRADLVVRG